MASARNEAPRRWGVERNAPSLQKRWVWEGAIPLPRICFRFFELKMASFGAFGELILLQ